MKEIGNRGCTNAPAAGRRARFVRRLTALIATLLIFVCLPGAAFGQRMHRLDLDQSLAIALDRSYDAQRLEQSLISSRMNLRAARLGFKSNGRIDLISFPNFQQSERQTPLVGGSFSFDRQKFLDLLARFSINQPVPMTDGTFSIVGAMQRFQEFGTFQRLGANGFPEMVTDPLTYSPQIRLQYRQPLFTLNRLKTGVRRAELNLENTLQGYQRSYIDIEFNVTTNFYALFRSQRQVEIDREQVDQSGNAYRIAKLKQQAGLLPEVEVLRLEVDLANARNTAASSEALLRQNEDRFKNLIGIPLADTVLVETDLEYTPVTFSEEKALQEALARRTELRSDEIAIELSTINVREVDTNKEISGELFVSYGLLNREDDLSAAFRDFDNDRSVNISLAVPIWDWGRNAAEVRAAEASLESDRLTRQNRSNLIREEIRSAVRSLASSQTRVEITRRSEELALKSYRISLLRFENGDISSQDLALEQNRLTQARTNYLNAIIDYKQALADLRRKTLWDFEKNSPVEVAVPNGQ